MHALTLYLLQIQEVEKKFLQMQTTTEQTGNKPQPKHKCMFAFCYRNFTNDQNFVDKYLIKIFDPVSRHCRQLTVGS